MDIEFLFRRINQHIGKNGGGIALVKKHQKEICRHHLKLQIDTSDPNNYFYCVTMTRIFGTRYGMHHK